MPTNPENPDRHAGVWSAWRGTRSGQQLASKTSEYIIPGAYACDR